MASIGSHGLHEQLAAGNLLNAFDKAVDYGLYNAIALIGLALLCQVFAVNRFHWAGYCLALGGFIFQTSLYLYTVAETNWITALTPFGGMLMILGWLLIGIFAVLTKSVYVLDQI